MDEAWLPVSFELGTQVAHVDFQDIRGTLEIQPPDTIQDDLAGEHLAWTAHKEREQLILRRRELNLTRPTMCYPCSGIQFDISIAQNLVLLLLAAPQQRLDPCHQL